jgi:uncharacterized protein (TIGR03437 family)
VEYAGAAPGLIAGVTQVNIKLPDDIPDVPGYPPGIIPLTITTGPTSMYAPVTIAVAK